MHNGRICEVSCYSVQTLIILSLKGLCLNGAFIPVLAQTLVFKHWWFVFFSSSSTRLCHLNIIDYEYHSEYLNIILQLSLLCVFSQVETTFLSTV